MAVATARDAERLLAPLLARADGERLAVIHLDGKGCAIAIEELEFDDEPLRAIVRAALHRDAAGLIIAHNHPSGDPRPSPEDIEATRRLARLGVELGIRLHDHLIFAGRACRSFRALGLL